jgi:shikimate dehydrogenase
LPDAAIFSRRGSWPPAVARVDLVVNATSERDAVVVELQAGQLLIDLPYPRTATARAAEAAGARVIDGLDVLVAQGAASFERWTGVPAPVDVMRAAVRSA